MSQGATPTRNQSHYHVVQGQAAPPNCHSVLRATVDHLPALFDVADDEFVSADLDVPDGVRERWQWHHIIVRVRRESAPTGNSDRCVYRADAGAVAVAQGIHEGRQTLPCGHGGLRNLRGDAGYSCGHDDCGARFSRDVVEEVFG